MRFYFNHLTFLIFMTFVTALAFFGADLSTLAVAEVESARAGQARPWLGVAIDVGPRGVLIKEVIPGTPAAESGIQAGDEITAVGELKILKPNELISAVGDQGVGNTVKISFFRKTASMTLEIKLVARPDELEMLRKQVEGKPAPSISLEAVSGKGASSLDGYKGKTVLVEFWATWCPACRLTHRRLSAFAKDSKDKGIVVLGVSNEEKKEITEYAKKIKPAFTMLRDAGDKLHSELKVNAIPMLLVIDKAGVVRFATIGGGSDLEEAIKKAETLARLP